MSAPNGKDHPTPKAPQNARAKNAPAPLLSSRADACGFGSFPNGAPFLQLTNPLLQMVCPLTREQVQELMHMARTVLDTMPAEQTGSGLFVPGAGLDTP